jgi:hypothetical protein
VLAGLAGQVPRCAFDERGATPWTSFRREVAVARRVSERAAAGEIRPAVSLTGRLPRMLALLGEGRVTVPRARAFVEELEGVEDDVACLVDARLADRVAGWSVARIVQETRRAVPTADPDEAARRSAQGTDSRAVSWRPEPHDQASVLITGPAVPLTRWHATLDSRARALKAAGDPRTLDQLRFDLAVTQSPCATHPPADPTAGPTGDLTVDLGSDPAAAAAAVSVGLPPSLVEPVSSDCRLSRPVQARITVPVETSLGLSNEPGWLDGYGWLSAPTCRLLLVEGLSGSLCEGLTM